MPCSANKTPTNARNMCASFNEHQIIMELKNCGVLTPKLVRDCFKDTITYREEHYRLKNCGVLTPKLVRDCFKDTITYREEHYRLKNCGVLTPKLVRDCFKDTITYREEHYRLKSKRQTSYGGHLSRQMTERDPVRRNLLPVFNNNNNQWTQIYQFLAFGVIYSLS